MVRWAGGSGLLVRSILVDVWDARGIFVATIRDRLRKKAMTVLDHGPFFQRYKANLRVWGSTAWRLQIPTTEIASV